MILREHILEWFPDEEIIFYNDFDDAIMGVCYNTQRVIYSKSKCIEILMEDMTEEEAAEYFDYNVAGAYLGPMTPIICIDDL